MKIPAVQPQGARPPAGGGPAGTTGARKRRPVRWRRWALGLVIFLVLLELGLRFILGLGDPLLFQPDPGCGYLPAPNQDVRRFFCTNRINNQSMRCDELRSPKPVGDLRVLFLGDSVTYGTTYVDQDDLFTSRLGPALTRRLGRTVEVLNASAGGWAVGNEVGYLRGHGTFDADQLVLVLNTGDLHQMFAPANFSLAGGFPDHRPLLATWELWVRYVRPRLGGPSVADAGSQAVAPPAPEAASATVRSQLGQMKQLCDARGIPLAIIYVPAQGDGWSQPMYTEAFAALEAWAQGAHVPLVDLTPDLRAWPVKATSFDGIHLRPFGHQVVAEAIERRWQELRSRP